MVNNQPYLEVSVFMLFNVIINNDTRKYADKLEVLHWKIGQSSVDFSTIEINNNFQQFNNKIHLFSDSIKIN